MARIVLVRHGQASHGAADYDKLSNLGHMQARWLGEYMRDHQMTFDRVVRGGLRRHRETWEGMQAVLGMPTADTDRRFDELHYEVLEREYLRNTGSNAPNSREDFLTLFPRLFSHWESGDLTEAQESFDTFRARVRAGISDVLDTGSSTLIVTSGGVIGVALADVLGLGTRATADLMLNIHNASVHELRQEGGRLRLALYNASPHLDPQDRSHARTYV